MPDATPRLEVTKSDMSMMDAGSRDLEHTATDSSMADASTQPSWHDLSIQDAGSMLSWSTRRSGSTQHSRLRSNHTRQTEEPTANLSRDLAAVKQEHSPAPTAPSHTDPPSARHSSLPGSSLPSTSFPNINTFPPSESSANRTTMNPSGPPSFYLPVWILEDGTFRSGQAITRLPKTVQIIRHAPLLSVNKNS